MSLPEEIAVGKRLVIRDARAQIARGKHFHLCQLAFEITSLRRDLMKEYADFGFALDTLMRNVDAGWGLLSRGSHLGTRLLQFALIDPKLLRVIAEEFRKLGDEGRLDPRAENIISAYEQCTSFPPSFSELKRTFINRFGESRWRGDFAVRKTLRSFNLALTKSKRGRPVGSRSKI